MAKASHAKAKKVGNISATALHYLYKWNKWLAVIYVCQVLVIVILGTSYTVPVSVNFLTADPINSAVAGHPILVPATRQLFQANILSLVIVAFLAPVIVHALCATVYRRRYEVGLQRAMNPLRWFEYALSGGLIVVALGLLDGIYDLLNLVMLFVFIVLMSALWLVTEVCDASKVKLRAFTYYLGCLAAIIPWVVLTAHIVTANLYGNSRISTFIYWVNATGFVCFIGLAIRLFVQYKGSGKRVDYLRSERNYMLLSLATKTVIVWQIFFGVLHT